MRVSKVLGWWVVAALVCVGLVAGLVTPGQAGVAKPKGESLVFASGPQGGSWLPVSAAIGEAVRKNIPGTIITVQPGGGTTNIKLVEQGDAQLAVTNSSSLYDAKKGLKPFDKPLTKIRALANIYPQTHQMMVLADAGIKEVEDIVGKRIVPAAPGQSTYDVNTAVIDIHGLTWDSLKAKGTKVVLTGAQGQANDMLRDKQIDGVWWSTACPSPGIVDVSLSRDVSFVGIRDDKLKQFLQKYPQFARSKIPAGTYKNQAKEVQTIGWFTTFIASTDMSNDMAYWIVKLMWENRKDLVSANALLSFIDLPTVATGVQIELHPGAKKFYQEIGAKID